MPRKLTAKERGLEILVHRMSELLRREGIWVLPHSVTEKEGRISVIMEVFSESWIRKHNGQLPIQTVLKIGKAVTPYVIPEAELEELPFAKRKE